MRGPQVDGESRRHQLGRHALLALGGCFLLGPVLLMLAGSLTPSESLAGGRVLDGFTVENYRAVLAEQPLAAYFAHSVIVSLATLALQLLVCVPAAYAMARLRFRGRGLAIGATTTLLLVPFQVVAVPVYLVIRQLGLVDSLAALVLPFVGSTVALVLLRQAFVALPGSIVDAARLDGASTLAVLTRVVVPASGAALTSLGVLTVTAAWNAYFWPSFVLTDAAHATIPFGVVAYLDTESGSRYGPQMAMATMSVLPLLLAFLLVQRPLVRGLRASTPPG